MPNRPVIMMVGRNIPPEIEENHNRWWDNVYAPTYFKPGLIKRIDRYKIIRKNILLPEDLRIYHAENLDNWIKQTTNVDRVNVIRDQHTTFATNLRFWHTVYELARSFKKSPFPQITVENTIVNDASVIHIEGYRMPEDDYGKYEQWFSRWACLVYIPLLLRIPGVKACNFFTRIDVKDAALDSNRYVEQDMPRYFSVIYFENTAALDSFNQSLELAAFRGSMEAVFPNMKLLWDTEYQLVRAYEPQP